MPLSIQHLDERAQNPGIVSGQTTQPYRTRIKMTLSLLRAVHTHTHARAHTHTHTLIITMVHRKHSINVSDSEWRP